MTTTIIAILVVGLVGLIISRFGKGTLPIGVTFFGIALIVAGGVSIYNDRAAEPLEKAEQQLELLVVTGDTATVPMGGRDIVAHVRDLVAGKMGAAGWILTETSADRMTFKRAADADLVATLKARKQVCQPATE